MLIDYRVKNNDRGTRRKEKIQQRNIQTKEESCLFY